MIQRATLERLVREYVSSRAIIADELGVSQSTVSYWLRKYELKTVGYSIPKVFKCMECDGLINRNGKYCSTKCRVDYHTKSTLIPKLNAGTLSHRPSIRRAVAPQDGYACSICGIDTWCNEFITLQLDHIDGDASNNTRSNLRLLCANCHSQTSTFAGGNFGNFGNFGNGRGARGISLG